VLYVWFVLKMNGSKGAVTDTGFTGRHGAGSTILASHYRLARAPKTATRLFVSANTRRIR